VRINGEVLIDEHDDKVLVQEVADHLYGAVVEPAEVEAAHLCAERTAQRTGLHDT
jgi:hypothetical protein